MTVERWRQIESIYQSALDRSPEERAGFIAEACKDDPNLRNEVEDLVRRDESPAWSLRNSPVRDSAAEPGAQFAKGHRLGPYEIVGALGSGGMGVVYRAIDTRLGRNVAVKTSRGPFSDRFAREARTVAALNHPNICTLYDTGPDYLVMELIEGPTLADRLRKGPLPFDEALRIASQIADAIETAHEHGIIHRDLKPANIKFRADGSAKVLDFGLAKSFTRPEPSADSHEIQRAGMILGTAAYMSPEQALGQEVDKRSDIWAFGVVLYEMLTGSRPFDGDTASDSIADIVRKEPDLSKVPARVRRVVGLCLEKDPRKRLRSLGGWEHLVESGEAAAKSSAGLSPRKLAWFAIPVILLAAAAGSWSTWFRTAPLRTTRFQVHLPEGLYFDRWLCVSPDGRKLVFRATGDGDGLWIHSLDTLEWRRLPGTERGLVPFWAPDSRTLGFVVINGQGTEFKKVDISGGESAVTFYNARGQDLGAGAWNSNGDLLIGSSIRGGPMYKLPAGSSQVSPLTALDRARGEIWHASPQYLPDGKHFLYWMDGPAGVRGTYAGSFDATPAEQPHERILAGSSEARYVDGRLIFLRGGALMAQRFDADRRMLVGEPEAIADNVQMFGVPASGVLAYRSGVQSLGYQFTWFDRTGKEQGIAGEPGRDVGPRLSPDQRRLALIDSPASTANIWIRDLARGLRSRLTFQPPAASPVWSPDGKRIFFSAGPKLDAIFVKDSSGAGPETELFRQTGTYLYPTSISPDGRYLLYSAMPKPEGPGVDGQVYAIRVQEGARPAHLLGGQFSENRAVFSPDGKWVAYCSNESGSFQVYIRRVVESGSRGLALGEGKWQASKEPVTPNPPVWRGDGKELYYLSEHDIMMAVPVTYSGSDLQLGAPAQLFTTPCSCEFDVSRDGQRFLVRNLEGMDSKEPITVVLNWQTELKKQ
jgi:Tol biopolymer transport system component